MKRYWRLFRPHYAETRRLALPVIIAQVGQITVGMVDNMMIGHLGKTELAAAAFANTLFSLPLIFGMGFAMAITPLVGKAFGKKQYEHLHFLKYGAYTTNSLMGIILALTCLALYYAMPFMHQPESIIQQSQTFFNIISLSIIPLMLFLSGKQLAEGLSNTRLAMVVTLIANVMNILGNYILIFGKMGAPELGLYGAGWSTLIARVAMAVIMTAFIRNYKPLKTAAVKLSLYRILQTVKSIVKLGVPMGLHLFSEASAFIVAGIMIGWLSDTGLAAHQIVISLSTFGFMLYQGIGAGTTIRISQFSARQVPALIKQASQASFQIVIAMVVVISSAFLLLRNWLPQLFTNDAEVIALASKMIVVLVIFQLFDAIQIIYSSILRGMADATIPGILTIISYFGIAIPFSYWAAFKAGFGEIGIWLGFPIGLGVCALLFHFRLQRLNKKAVQIST
ncbi:MATE family efflux transporter [Carboxylicivirga sp. A043]|uniref:MATE family efflux transporter n=1 Tax=Carboxylicivirga litoralis TaxID=2816963 RepID=UPI0021CAF5A0|nr:MATE family efflux transporter [Carboxylicivirga sp. A043]MCU4155582.1 MATE family efflux transporter [Carboxylicivirga sp. A043]